MAALDASADAQRQASSGQANGDVVTERLHIDLVIVPQQHSSHFRSLCELNPHVLPLLAVSKPGEKALPCLGEGVDVCARAGRYIVYEDGRVTNEPSDLIKLWRSDFVVFALLSVDVAAFCCGEGAASSAMHWETKAPGNPLAGRVALRQGMIADPDSARRNVSIGCQTRSFAGVPLHLEAFRAANDSGASVPVLAKSVQLPR